MNEGNQSVFEQHSAFRKKIQKGMQSLERNYCYWHINRKNILGKMLSMLFITQLRKRTRFKSRLNIHGLERYVLLSVHFKRLPCQKASKSKICTQNNGFQCSLIFPNAFPIILYYFFSIFRSKLTKRYTF